MIGTFWSLVPSIVAITLALITKEVYSSLFIGVVIGAVFFAIGSGTLLIEGDKKEFEALGHCAAYTFPKSAPVSGDYFFCHGYSVKKNGTPILVTRKISWTADGWPRLQ